MLALISLLWVALGGDREYKCSSGREVYDWKKVGGSKEKANSAASTTFHVGLHRAPVPHVRCPANPAPDHASQWGISQMTDMYHIHVLSA